MFIILATIVFFMEWKLSLWFSQKEKFHEKIFLFVDTKKTKWRFVDTHFKYEISWYKVGEYLIVHINSEDCVYLCTD